MPRTKASGKPWRMLKVTKSPAFPLGTVMVNSCEEVKENEAIDDLGKTNSTPKL